MIKNNNLIILTLFVTPWLTKFSQAGPVRVITTGDSLTAQYYSKLDPIFQQLNFGADVLNPVFGVSGSINTARGGMSASIYTGHASFDNKEPINYASNVLTANPDVIIYMLGINDLYWGTYEDNANSNSAATNRFQNYSSEIEPVFNQFANFTNSHSNRPVVYISSILPFDLALSQSSSNTNLNSGALDRIQKWYNPWLRDQSSRYGFTYVDLWSEIQLVVDWKSKFLSPSDGLHLSQEGSNWVATQFAQAVVPEPSILILLGGIGLFVFWRNNSSRKECSI